MANYPNYNLTGKRPSDTYQNIVQYNVTASNLVNSLGNELTQSINITASVFGTSSFAVSSSWAMTASFAYVSFVTQSITQSVTQSIVSSSFSSASFVATSASFASQSISSSWAPVPESASWSSASFVATSASFASQSISSSYAPQFEQISASWSSASFVASSASFASQSISSSFAVSASWAPDQTVTVNSASWASSSLSASVLFNDLSFVKLNGTAQFGNTTISQSFGPTFTLENPNPSNEFENTPAGILEFRCNEWSGSTDRRQVVKISATKDGTIPYGGASGQFILSVEDTSGGVMDRMVINRFATSFSGSVVATQVDNYGRSGFTGSLNGTASNAVSASWAPDQTVTVNSASWASASFVATSASFASQSISASYVPDLYPQTEQISASWASASFVATSASFASRSISASYAPFTQTEQISASWASASFVAVSASFASMSISASYAPFTQTEQISASWASASFVATSASFASRSISASYAPQFEQISASWASSSLTAITATSSLSASWVNTLNQEVDIEGPQGQGNTSTKTSLLVVGREGWPCRILQGGSFVTQSARPVLYVYRDLDQSQAQTTPILQLRNYETGSIAPLMIASNDASDVFKIDYSGSITASGLFGTASWANSVSASGVVGGLTITQYVTSGSGWVTMSFVNGLLISSL